MDDQGLQDMEARLRKRAERIATTPQRMIVTETIEPATPFSKRILRGVSGAIIYSIVVIMLLAAAYSAYVQYLS